MGEERGFVIENKEEIENAVQEARQAEVFTKMAMDAFRDLY